MLRHQCGMLFPASANKAHSADTTGDNFWGLVPDTLPHMEYAPTGVGTTVRVDTSKVRDAAPEMHGFLPRQ